MMKIKLERSCITMVFSFLIFLLSCLFISCENPLIQQIVDAKTAAFESNGGSSVESQTLFWGQSIKRPANPSRSGYTFDAWYGDNETFLQEWDFDAIPTGDITLYAKWVADSEPPVVDTFTVTFDKNGGDTDAIPASRTVEPGSLVAAPDTNPTRDSFEFGGWYTEADCITLWDFDADAVSADITLYAGWEAIPGVEYFTVTFDKNGGDTDASPLTRTVVSGSLVTAPEPPDREHFNFTGWYTEAACEHEWNFDTDTVSADITLYAGWEFDGDPLITSAAITVISPIAKAAPHTTASGAGNFTISAITWTPAAAAFIGGTEYTASVTLTAKTYYSFAEDSGFTATVNGNDAVVTNNTGDTVTISYQFGPAPDVTAIAVKTQPKLVYAHGQTLDLSDMVVTLTYGNGSTEDVAFAGFAGKNISEFPTHGTVLARMTHNDTKVTVSIGDYTDETNALTINKAIPAPLTWPSASAITYPATLSTSILTGGSETGTWTWQSGSTIPTVENSGYNVVFTPADTNNYDWAGVTLTQTVAITVNPAIITFSTLTANGSATATTTTLTLTFSAAIAGLSTDDITLSGVAGVSKGTLSGAGPTYTLSVSGFTTGGTLTVTVAKAGYNISGSPKTIAIYYATPVTFSTLTADGNATTITTTLTLTFSAAITGLSANDITLSGVTGVTKGTLSGAGPTYTLPISGFTSGGTLTVTVAKAGYNISDSPKPVAIYYFFDLNLEMVHVPGGSFQMGGDGQSTGDGTDSIPVHTVTLTGFYMGKYEVTQAQWQAVMGTTIQQLQTAASDGTTNYGRGDNYPVYYVSWYNALVFCNKLSVMEGLTPAYRINNSTNPDDWGTVPTNFDAAWNAVEVVNGSTGYRLPTEAQWEYAAKGGDGSPGNYTYAGSNTVDDVAWYSTNSGNTAHTVGTKAANGLGLYDMSGNVYEWCWDWYGNYSSGPQTDPTGAPSPSATGTVRVMRGGSRNNTEAQYIRSAFRNYNAPISRNNTRGFRVLRPSETPPATIISSAVLTVTAPANGGTPAPTASGTGNFIVGTVSWSPSVTTFTTGQPYTVSITLTANANYTFTGGLATAATINGYNANVSNNTGASVTLSYQFAAIPADVFGTSAIRGITYGDGKFVAVGYDGKMAYSTDSINWTAVTTSTFDTSNIMNITYADGKFVAVGYDGKMAYSADGITWSGISATNSTFGTNRIQGIVYGDGKFVAGGYSGRMAYSLDGISWTAVADSAFNTAASSAIARIAYGDGKFVAVGLTGQMAYSPDGINWTAVTDNTFTDIIYGIAYGNSKFVAVGLAGKMAYSPDGITWTAVANNTFSTAGNTAIWGIVYGGGKFVAGGSSGRMAYSLDGISWTAVADSAFGSSTPYDIAYGDGKFVAGGTNGKMAYSTDGINWTAVP